ncbi:MAG TPA: sn-glycerol-1-phosphate dehydrogenase [Acidimicrobiales bacterium]|nr:sn-glycerol-1-phosphate dehydrogenase [Acidimicrobiales bacterium]
MSASPCPACGLDHEVPVEEVVVGLEALERLGAYVDQKHWRRLLLVDDANTAEALGDRLAEELGAAGHLVTRLSFRERSGLLADEGAVAAARARLGADGPDGVLAVGSGVINDVTRYATFLEGRPYVSVPTAASMDGYASNVAAMQFDGVKVSHAAHTPLAVFADLGVVAGAPPEMTVWGLGDLLGKACARFDWALASGLLGEVFCPVVEARVLGPLGFCTSHAAEVRAGRPDAVGELVRGLVESGIAMAMMGSSRPASGCEHHASHFWDLLAFRGLRPHGPHGLQVGYATHFAMALQRRAAALVPGAGPPVEAGAAGRSDDAEARRWFGAQLDALEAVRREKAEILARGLPAWPRDPAVLGALAARLAGVASGFDQVSGALADSGIPATPGFLGLDGATLRATFRFANRLRARYTTLDLLEGLGSLDASVEEILPGP